MSACECSDPGCPVHKGLSECQHAAAHTLYRVDMEDYSGVAFCEGCAEDAADSGVFTDAAPDEDEQADEDAAAALDYELSLSAAQ